MGTVLKEQLTTYFIVGSRNGTFKGAPKQTKKVKAQVAYVAFTAVLLEGKYK